MATTATAGRRRGHGVARRMAGVLLAAWIASAAAEEYSIVVLSDTHIGEGYSRYDGSDSYSNYNLRAAAAKINAMAAAENIRFAFVTGDLTDSGEVLEFDVVRRELDALQVPYFPLLGNHDTWPYDDFGNNPTPDGDALFATTFADKFRPPFPVDVSVVYNSVPVLNPEFNVTSWFQNYMVRSGDLVFICLDWNTRQAPRRPGYEERGVGPTAQIHNFPGGTLQWLNATLVWLKTSGTPFTDIVFLQHHPYQLQIYAPDIIYGFSPEKKRQRFAGQDVGEDAMYGGDGGGGLHFVNRVFAGHLHRFYTGEAFDEPEWATFSQWETDACKGHQNDIIPKEARSAFSLVRIKDGRIAAVEQFVGPYDKLLAG